MALLLQLLLLGLEVFAADLGGVLLDHVHVGLQLEDADRALELGVALFLLFVLEFSV